MAKLPKGTIPTVPAYAAVQQSRALKDGKLNFLWQLSDRQYARWSKH